MYLLTERVQRCINGRRQEVSEGREAVQVVCRYASGLLQVSAGTKEEVGEWTSRVDAATHNDESTNMTNKVEENE